jgi:hypothetical protein
LSTVSRAQNITGIGSRWSDDLSEWVVYADEELEGSLTLRWPLQRDWTQWQFRLEEVSGQIRLKWPENPNEWEIRSGAEVVTARTLFRNNFREWRITAPNIQLTLVQRFGNTIDEWMIRPSNETGSFELLTTWQNDPREWEIYDELDESVTFTTKMAIVFITLYHSLPRG